MSALRPRPRRDRARAGGIVGYPLEWVYQEVAFLGRHAHWPLAETLDLDHAERRRWVGHVGAEQP